MQESKLRSYRDRPVRSLASLESRGIYIPQNFDDFAEEINGKDIGINGKVFIGLDMSSLDLSDVGFYSCQFYDCSIPTCYGFFNCTLQESCILQES